MKTSSWMRLSLGLAFLAVGATAASAQMYVATLSGKDASPPVSSQAVGTATIRVLDGSLSYKLDVGAIEKVTSACIHIATPKPAVIQLYGGPETGKLTGQLAAGTLKPADLGGLTRDEFLAALKEGRAYVSVHTIKYPGGEIQGKLTPPAPEKKG